MANSAHFDMHDILQSLDKFSLTAEGKGIVLLLGETGSGKSTLAQFIAGLQLDSVGEDGHFTIQDKSGRISSRDEACISKTIDPELLSYVDYNGEHMLMDTPGFEDTRSSHMEVKCALKMKNALRYFPMIKIILVISYDDIRIGGRRDGFVRLIKNTAAFLKSFNDFERSIGLIVTKIPPVTAKVGKVRMLLSDDKWKQNIKSALTNLRNSIYSGTDIPKEKKSIYKYTLKVIEILLRDDNHNNNTSVIGIFRSPEEEGPINDMELFSDCREALRNLASNLQYASARVDDFGYTISDSARQIIATEVPHIVETIVHDLDFLLKRIEHGYNEFEIHEDSISELLQEFRKQSELWEGQFIQINKMKRTSEVLNFLLKMLEDQAELPLVSKYSTTCGQNAEREILVKLAKYSQLVVTLELVSNIKFSTTTKEWENLFTRTMKLFFEGEMWYESISTITRLLQCDVVSSRNSAKATKFMKDIEEFIKANKPVPGKLFTNCFSESCQFQNVVKINYDVSVVKLDKLLKNLISNQVCKVPEDPVTEKEIKDIAKTVKILKKTRPRNRHRCHIL